MKHFTLVDTSRVAVAFLVCLMTGCATATLPDATPVATPQATATTVVIVPVTSEPDPLDGTYWELVAFVSQGTALPIPEERPLIARFRKGGLARLGGCNEAWGNHILEGDRITNTFAEQTAVGCPHATPGMKEAVDAEVAFFKAMTSFTSHTITGEELSIDYPDGMVLLRRVAEGEATGTPEAREIEATILEAHRLYDVADRTLDISGFDEVLINEPSVPLTEEQADRVRAWFGSVSREEAGYLTYVRGCYLTRRDAEQPREGVSAGGTGGGRR